MGYDWSRLWSYATTDGVPQRSLNVALVVGTVLNLINQGDAIWGAATLNWWKLALTYMVPFLVSMYGAVTMRIRLAR